MEPEENSYLKHESNYNELENENKKCNVFCSSLLKICRGEVYLFLYSSSVYVTEDLRSTKNH